MNIRHTLLGILVAWSLTAVAGCKKTNSVETPPSPPALSPETVARIHWLGKKQLGLDAGAYYLSRIWGLPETLRLQSQTLDKLSIAPWRLVRDETSLTNIPAGLVRPLLEDMVQEESFLEINQPTNQAAEIVFAVRLNAARAGLWETNLAVSFESLTGVWPQKSSQGQGWSLRRPQTSPELIELTRVGNWTLIAFAKSRNELLVEISNRIQRYGVPFFSRPTNYWMEAELDLERTLLVMGIKKSLPDKLPRLWLGVEGDGGNVISRGSFTFPARLNLPLENWNIPTNLIHEPLASFTALRGTGPLTSTLKIWNGSPPPSVPNQLFFWSLDGAPMQSYFAAPVSNVGDRMNRLSDAFLQKGNSWLAAHGVGSFQKLAGINGINWQGIPALSPFVVAVDVNGGCLYGGTAPDAGAATNPPASDGMLHDVVRRTNLVCYDWEVTSSKLLSNYYLSQTARSVSRHSQLPLECSGSIWLNLLMSRVNTSTTLVTLAAPDRLTWIRKSTLGFTAAELHLMVDWFESPRFPLGLYSTVIPPAQP